MEWLCGACVTAMCGAAHLRACCTPWCAACCSLPSLRLLLLLPMFVRAQCRCWSPTSKRASPVSCSSQHHAAHAIQCIAVHLALRSLDPLGSSPALRCCLPSLCVPSPCHPLAAALAATAAVGIWPSTCRRQPSLTSSASTALRIARSWRRPMRPQRVALPGGRERRSTMPRPQRPARRRLSRTSLQTHPPRLQRRQSPQPARALPPKLPLLLPLLRLLLPLLRLPLALRLCQPSPASRRSCRHRRRVRTCWCCCAQRKNGRR